MSSPVRMTAYRPDYIIIPRPLLEDEELQPKARELYGYIYWLSQLSKGKCVASNELLADLIGRGTTPQSITNILSVLEKQEYIKRIFTDSTKMERLEIVPLITYKDLSRVPHETMGGIPPDDGAIAPPNGVQIYNKIHEKKMIIPSDRLSLLPIKANTPLLRLSRFYSALYREQFGTNPVVKIAGKDGGIFKSLLKTYTEFQIAALLVVHFNWQGPYDQDENEFERLKANAFPLGWLSNAINKYVVYLSEQEDVDMNDAECVARYVNDYVKGMDLSAKS